MKNGTNKGANNPRYKYIILYDNKIIQRSELSKLINMAQSTTDVIIKKAANGKYHKKLIELNIIITKKEGQSTIESTSNEGK